jgi:predicted transposase YbfD/YdcC
MHASQPGGTWLEITAIPKLQELLDLHAATVTIDAMGCQYEIGEKLIAYGGDSVLALKGHQPAIHDKPGEAFEEACSADRLPKDV